MLNTKPFGLMTELAKQISAKDKVIQVTSGDGVKFKVPGSDHFYITVRNGAMREFMKVTSVNGDTLHVERGIDESTPVSFPKGACVKVDWTPTQLCEYVQSCVQGEVKKSVDPQTICFTCDTCIEIDEGGHVISVNGSEKC